MKLVFLPEAEQDIDRLHGFLVTNSPVAAQKAMLAIDEGIALLMDNPHMGIEMVPNADYRQLFIPFGKSAYVLRYRIDEDRNILAVVRVWHGREHRGRR